jgi:dTDP-glucose 4,6-dehydratase
MKNILITGGAGFIGSNFIRYLFQKEPDIQIVNLDKLTYAGSLENLIDIQSNERYSFIKGDICDHFLVTEIFHEHKIDTIIHFAAESHVDRSIINPELFIQTNIYGTYSLLEAARNYWLNEKSIPSDQARFHHVSTDEVFGSLEPEDPPFSETSPYSPNSPYAASKASSDHLVRAYAKTYGLPISITNCSNNYGPYQFPEKLIPLVILNAIDGKHLPIYGDGKQVRDWLFVMDHCEAIWTILRNGQIGGFYTIGGNIQPTNLDLVRTLCSVLDELLPNSVHLPHAGLIQFVEDRPGHDRRYAIDISKIRNALDWYPKESLKSGLRKTVSWYIDHPEWVSVIREKVSYQNWIERNYDKRGVQP